MKLLTVFLLISASLSIKIKIKTPRTGGGGGSSPAPGGWNTNRTCGTIAPQIQMGTIFSIYAEQLYNIFNDPINELLLVKHERQIVAGVNHRMIFRVRDKQTNDKLYIGMSLFVDLQGGVRVTGYLESFELQDIVNALGFNDGRLFRYRCNDLNGQAVQGFTDWARELARDVVCQNNGGGFNDLDPLDNGSQYNPNSGYQPQPQPQPQTSDPFGGDNGPFEKTININIRGRHKDGTPFLIGSSRPKK